jgi:glutamine amidotransferase
MTDQVIVSNLSKDIRDATHLVLPGVGAFGEVIQRIRKHVPLDVLQQEVFMNRKPFLGICVGMQVLADTGYEFGKYEGLGWIPGKVKKIESGVLPLPHIGWNDIAIRRESALLNGFAEMTDFYFVHSYAYESKDPADVIAVAYYGEEFPCVLGRDNVFGVQFHPEKSQKAGKLLIQNFLAMGVE